MEPSRAAVVYEGVVINIIMANADVDPAPPDCILVDVTDRECDIGWLYDYNTDTFTDPNPPPPDGVV